MGGHLITAHFGKVSADDPEVEAVEEEQQPEVHGDLRLDEHEDVEAEQGAHDDEVTQDAHGVGHLVDHQEPLVNQSEMKERRKR